MTSTKPQTVVIVGAGIAGLSAAFHLADRQVRRIVLLDKDKIGSGSSSSIRSGAVNTMLQGTEATSRARGISFDIFERFNRILDDYEFHQVGCLGIYTPQQFKSAAQLHDMQRSAGARFEVLSTAELEARFPDMHLKDGECGVLDLRGGYSEPDRYIPVLAAKVRALGVEISEDETVEDFLLEGGNVRDVRLRGGEELRADATVCTVKAWANSLLARVGQPLPVRNVVHERFVTKPIGRPIRLPAVNDDAIGIYYRPTERGGLLLGADGGESAQVEPGPDFDMAELEPTPGILAFIREAAPARLPFLGDVEIDYHRVGLISCTVDLVPNIGPVESLPDLYLATNFCSGGFGYHPVAGLILAEYILDGDTSIDAREFSPDRFKDFDTQGFLGHDMTRHDMVEAVAAKTRGYVRKRH